ncbi:beta-propeller domain-containing protein [Myxococcus landrumensis]|uniref:Beta-propeller domain-containing protein n=1 Tax=Myxococcus landrumensis TaxID=2813577 RepID=A0ABX7N485_9BACT|nr:beta-propeller domain-containing protein [Myxococcus landrumus]QSQ12394.1 beta-propeller domain-containing protein [Myxococcus landrumus]
MRPPRLHRRHLLSGLLLALVISACPPERRPLTRAEVEAITFTRLERFGTEQAFDFHLELLARIRDSLWEGGGPVLGCGGSSGDGEALAPAPPPQDPSITHNQESGVDEGDIVKAVGDWFVVLRRGRLFTVRQVEGALQPVAQVAAYPRGLYSSTWYDEMLVHGRRVIVVGYSYSLRSTEIALFRLDDAGGLTHEGTHFIGSSDYYSARGYASRLVNGTLVFYMPITLSGLRGQQPELPRVRTWLSGTGFSEWNPVLSRMDIYKPLQTTLWPMLHTVVRCDLNARDFSCTASALMGPRSNTFYVSRDAVYAWVSPGFESWTVEGEKYDPERVRDSVVYRLPLDGGEPTALRTRGSPTDAFSLRENEDGHLDALLVSEGMGSARWGRELSEVDGPMALMRAPLSDFSQELAPFRPEHFTVLPGPTQGLRQNRFVGNHVLWGSGEAKDSWSTTPGEQAVWVTDLRWPREVHRLSLGHTVLRLEPLGPQGALVVGDDPAGLHLTSLALGDGGPERRGYFRHQGSTQGETRSHGFFFKPAGADGGGVLGLPLRLQGGQWSHLRYGSAEVSFMRVDPDLKLSNLGTLKASETSPYDDSCSTSCVDWYGNARPIFYRDRVFALMGYELLEARVTGSAVEESFRVSYLQPAR